MNSELAFIEECKHKLKQIKQSKASKIVRIAES